MKNKKSEMTKKFPRPLKYILITLGILLIISLGVYALTPGVAPDPGHLISEVAPPAGCVAGQFLEFDGTNWICASAGSCPPGTHLVTNTYTNGIEDVYGSPTFTGYAPSCSTPTDICDGNQNNAYTCGASESKVCTDVYKTPTGGIAPYTCSERTITCKKAAMLCGE